MNAMVFVTTALVVTLACTGNADAAEPQQKNPAIGKFQPFKSKRIKQLPRRLGLESSPGFRDDPQPIQIRAEKQDWIAYTSYGCDAAWNQRCEGRLTVTAPDGFQACQPLFGAATQINDWGFNLHHIAYEADPRELPPKYRGYEFFVRAWGSNNALDRWGSNMTIVNIGIQLIPDWANNDDRRRLGCRM